MQNPFQQWLYFLVTCFIIAVLGVCYFLGSMYVNIYGEKEIISPLRIEPELQLTIKDNKVDTLFIYKLKEK